MAWYALRRLIGPALALLVVATLAAPAAPVEAPPTTGATKPQGGRDFAMRLILAVGEMVGVRAERVQLARERIPETIYIARMQDDACGDRCKTIFFLERIGPNSVVGIFDLGRDYALTEAKQTLPGEAVARPVFKFASGEGDVSVIYFRGGRMHEHRAAED